MSSGSGGSGVGDSPITLKVLGRQRESPKLLYNLYQSEAHTRSTEEVIVGELDEIIAIQASGILHQVTNLIVSRGVIEGTWPERVNSSVCQILAEARNLEKFVWVGIPLATKTLDTLRRCCRRIKSIHVEFPENMEEMVLGLSIANDELEDDESDEDVREARVLYRAPSFGGFPEIESLHVYNMFDNLRHFREDLVQVLREAPNIRTVGLSLAIESIARCYNAGQVAQYDDWFDKLCAEYRGFGAPRLQIEALICGTAIYPKGADVLVNFTDPVYLEQVHIENKDVSREGKYISVYGSDEHSNIAFASILSKQSRKMRRFSAFQFRDDVIEALGGIDDPSITRQLALSFENQKYLEIHDILRRNENYPHFPLQLRMVDLDLQRQEWEEFTAESILNSLVASKQDTLEGVMVHLPEEPGTDGGFAHLDTLGRALGRLPNLGQLAIGMDKFGRARSRLAEAQLRHSAKLLATAAPQLRFINIYWMFWRISRSSDAIAAEAVLLEELGSAEREHVELWVHTIFRP